MNLGEPSTSNVITQIRNNIFVIVYILVCVGVAYYIKEQIAEIYTTLLLNLEYSNRNQSICGSSVIERDTIRYTMNNIVIKPISNNLLYLIIFVAIVTFAFIILYFYAHTHEAFKYFNNDSIYVTNIVILFLMGCCIGFWFNYTKKIQKLNETNVYDSFMNIILKSSILPPPKPITDNKSVPVDKTAAKTHMDELYKRLINRMMYVDNLQSYQDAINKWNSFTKNSDIYPYLKFSNTITNDVTPETIEAANHLYKLNKELNNNPALAKSKVSDSIIYNLEYKDKRNLVINYVDNKNIVFKNNILQRPKKFTQVKVKINTLDRDTVSYINKYILAAYINTTNNREKSDKKSIIPSTIDGIKQCMIIFIGSQNINNDYTILYKEAEEFKDGTENTDLKNALFWLSNLTNGDPTNDIYSVMKVNAILYYIINVGLTYVPFHFMYVSLSPMPLTLFIIVSLIISCIIIQFYYSYIDYQSRVQLYKKNNIVK